MAQKRFDLALGRASSRAASRGPRVRGLLASRPLPVRIGIGLGVCVLGFLGAPAAYACSICNAEGIAVTNLLTTGTEAGAAVAVPAELAAAVETAVTAVTVGEATSIGVTGLAGLGAAVGIPMLIGGIGDWKWGSNGTGLPMPPLGGSAAIYYGDYPPNAGADLSWTSSVNGLAFSSSVSTGGTYHYGAGFCRYTAQRSTPYDPAAVYNAFKTFQWAPGGGVPAMFGTAIYMTGYMPNNVTGGWAWGQSCGAGTVPAFFMAYRSTQNNNNTKYSGFALEVIVPDYVPAVANPSDPYPGRTIEQTVTCKTKAGATYTRNVSTSIATGLNGTPITIAGVMCDPSDLATGGAAVVKSPGKPDTVLNGEVTTAPRWANLPEASRFEAADASTDHTWTFIPEKPGESKVPLIEPGNPSTPPGTDTGTGTNFCGMEFADLLTGAVMFKAVGCAISWAFVPSSGYMATTQAKMADSWSRSPVGEFVSGGAGMVGAFGSLGDFDAPQSRMVSGKAAAALPAGADMSVPLCRGPVFSIPLGPGDPLVATPLNACDEPMSTVAWWTKLLLTIALIVGASVTIVNMVVDGLRLVSMPEASGYEHDGQGRLF